MPQTTAAPPWHHLGVLVGRQVQRLHEALREGCLGDAQRAEVVVDGAVDLRGAQETTTST